MAASVETTTPCLAAPVLSKQKSIADTSELLMDAVIEACRKAEEFTGAPVSDTGAEYPCVDISSWTESPRDPSKATERKQVVAAVLEAATTKGAFHVRGHGVSVETIGAAMVDANGFFAQPLEKKAACKTAGQLTGYTETETESVNSLFGRKGGRDQREIFGLVTPVEDAANEVLEGGDSCVSLLPSIRAYAQQMDRLEVVIYEILTEALSTAKGVELPPDFLFRSKGGSGGLLRVNHYPASKEPPADRTGQLPGHSDWGAITILYADAPGLEEIHGNGVWEPVAPDPEALHVNLGDNLHIWSNGLFVNNVHRVNISSGASEQGRPARTSLAYFSAQAQNGTENVRIEPVCAEGEIPVFEKVSVAEYVAAGIRRYLVPAIEP